MRMRMPPKPVVRMVAFAVACAAVAVGTVTACEGSSSTDPDAAPQRTAAWTREAP